MATVGAYEAKTHLPALLDRVAKGEQITITKHGVPVARLVPVQPVSDREKRLAAIAELKRLREKHPLNGVTIRELIEDGRRF
ncbi:MAG: type II toxin-antitoxin system prevent-host-death family antitoxin [Bryobacteraceae bacterium]|jgi:prevent-host-death family protein